jgi:hypothetical protein
MQLEEQDEVFSTVIDQLAVKDNCITTKNTTIAALYKCVQEQQAEICEQVAEIHTLQDKLQTEIAARTALHFESDEMIHRKDLLLAKNKRELRRFAKKMLHTMKLRSKKTGP